jgi:hypothetical protein
MNKPNSLRPTLSITSSSNQGLGGPRFALGPTMSNNYFEDERNQPLCATQTLLGPCPDFMAAGKLQM